MINIKENEDLSKLNHSCAHLLAQAVKHLYPNAKFWVGPVIEEGFYYDIDLGDDVIKEDIEIERFSLPKQEALKLMDGQPYKQELINDLAENVKLRKSTKYIAIIIIYEVLVYYFYINK